MYMQFHYWCKTEILYLLISGSIGPKEVNQFSCHADTWNWSCCQGNVVKWHFVDDLPSLLLYLVPCSLWKELPSRLYLKTVAAKTTLLLSEVFLCFFSDTVWKDNQSWNSFPIIYYWIIWGYDYLSEYCCFMEASVVELQGLLFTNILAVLHFFHLKVILLIILVLDCCHCLGGFAFLL